MMRLPFPGRRRSFEAPAARKGFSRRAFVAGSVAAAGGIAAISLTSCSSDGGTTTGEPQVVTDESQVVGVLDGDYAEAESPYEPVSTWSLPLGTVLHHVGGSWAAAMLTPASSQAVNSLGCLSLMSGALNTLVATPTRGSAWDFFDVRGSDEVFAWVEIHYNDRAWVLLAQGFADGALTGEPVQLDEGDIDWEPPRFTTWGPHVIWQRMPLATGGSSAEDSHCYLWKLGDDEGTELWTSHGRFATSPHVADGILTIAPRVLDDEGVYYGITAVDIADEDRPQRDQLVLPASVAPFETVYMNETFVFSIEASYEGRGSLGNMGTFIGREGGPYVYVRREPLACVAGRGTRYLVKAQSSHFVVDTQAMTYATLRGPDRAVDYGDWPASEGSTELFLTYATVRNAQGVPESVTARVFSL